MAMAPKQIGKVYTVPNLTASATITLPSPPETYRLLRFNQTSVGSFNATLPTPSDTSIHFAIDIVNIGSEIVRVNLVPVEPLEAFRLSWSGSAWAMVSSPFKALGDQIASATAPSFRPLGSTLQDADLWLDTSKNELKFYEGSGWKVINDPLRVIDSNLSINTFKSESFLVKGTNNTITLNATPADGEHVVVFLDSSTSETDVNGTLVGGGTSVSLGGAASTQYLPENHFIYDAARSAWRLISSKEALPGYTVIGRYDPGSDAFTSQTYTTYTSLPPASSANAGQVFELADDVEAASWTSANAPAANASLGDWIISNGTVWALWRNQDVRIGRGDQLSGTTAPTVRNTDHALRDADIWYNPARFETKVYDTAATEWKAINDPVTRLNGGNATSRRSEAFLVDLSTASTITLNPTPDDGEHVTVYLENKAEATVTSAKGIRDELGTLPPSTSVTYDARYFSVVDFIYNVDQDLWRSFVQRDMRTGGFMGFYFPSSDRFDDTTGATIAGGLPPTSDLLMGQFLIIRETGSTWASTANLSFMGGQYYRGDLLWCAGPGGWIRVNMSDVPNGGDQQSSASTPTSKSNGSALAASDIWYNSTRKDTKIYDGSAWVDINEPATVLNVGGAATTTRSENFVCMAPGATVNLNSSPQPGEKVEVFLGASGSCTVIGQLEGGLTQVNLGNVTHKQGTFIWDSFTSVWIYELVARNSVTVPGYSEGTLAARPATGTTEGDIYKVTGDTEVNNGRTFVWDAGLASWREIGSDLFGTGLAAARPATATDGFMYYATDTLATSVYDAAASTWRTLGSTAVTVSDTAPAVAAFKAGDLWWDSLNLELYVLHNDGVTKAWVSASGANGPLTAPVNTVAGGVINCSLGNFYELSIGTNTTLSFTNPPSSGNAYIATVKVNVTSSATLSYPAAVKWPGAVGPTLGNNKSHILTFMTYDGGVSWLANALTEY